MFFQPKRVEKPWGYEVWFAQAEKYVGKVIHIDEGNQLSLQYHVVKDETVFCLKGNARFVYEKDGVLVDEVFPEGMSFRVKPGMRHRLKAGEGGCDILEASTPETDDVVRLEDNYGRIA